MCAELGAGAGTSYPAVLDYKQTWVNVPGVAPDSASRIDAEVLNDYGNAIVALETALGVLPAGGFPSVAARLNAFLPPGLLTAGGMLYAGGAGPIAMEVALWWDSIQKFCGINTSAAPVAPLDVRHLAGDGAYRPVLRVGDAPGGTWGTIGIRQVSGNLRQGMKLHSTVSLSLHAASQNMYFQTGNVPDETVDTGTRMTIFNDGGVVVGNPDGTLPVGGSRGHGTLNAVAVYDDSVVLTCYPLAYALDQALALDAWDAKSSQGTHGPAHAFAPRAARDTDLPQYIEFWQTHRHLPSLPNPQDTTPETRWSVGDLVQRLWETVELQAVHMAQLHARVCTLEAGGTDGVG